MKKKTKFADKPYNRCIPCPHRTIRCDGARSSAMELPRWCEYMRDMKEANGQTNAEVAEIAGVSIKTVERLMALNCDQDIMRETARRIENAIVGSSNRYPCYLAFEEENLPSSQKLSDTQKEVDRLLQDNNDYRTALDNIHASYQAELDTVRADDQKKIDHLLEEIERLKKQVDFLQEENALKRALVNKYLEVIGSK